MALTKKSVDFYSRFYHDNIPQEFFLEMTAGAINEDTPPRWINHFYDPTTGKGWTGERMGQLPADVVRQLALLGLSSEKAVSALEWAHNQILQDRYLSYEGNRTFEKAVYDYIKGDKKSAYRSLGHLLHLIQDLTVPAHTRQDTHFEALGDPGEPYEKWASDNGDLSRLTDDYLAQSDFKCADLDDCFQKIAQYSNANFFSENTINDNSYNLPIIVRKEKKGIYDIFYDKNNYPLVVLNHTVDKYTVDYQTINQSYWDRLSEKAVLGSVEVIRLFHEYVAQAQKNPNLIEKPPVSSSAFFFKVMMTGLPGILAPAVEPPVFSLYGGIIQIKKAVVGIFNEITALFGQNQESFQANIINLPQTDVEDAASAQSSAAEPKLPTSEIIKKQIPAADSISDTANLSAPTNLENIPGAPSEKNDSSLPVAIKTNQQMPTTPPNGFNFFIGGGTLAPVESIKVEPATTSEAKFEPEPALIPEPILPEIVFVSAPHIITADGQVFRTADDISTSSNGVQIDLIGTSTPNLPVFISINSSSTVQDYSALASAAGDWRQMITLNEGLNTVIAKARNANDNESDIVSITLFLDIIFPSQIANHIIVNEVQLRDNEFVELYNPTNENIDISEWYFSYYSHQHDWDSPYRSKKFPTGAVIPANGYYLIGLNGYSDMEHSGLADWQPYSSNLLNNEKGSIAIFPWNPNGKDIGELKNNYIDALGWGDANYVYETAPIADIPNINESLTRSPNYWDTDNNKNDFQTNNQPLPVNSNHGTRTIIPDSTIITEDTVWVAERSPYILESNFNASPTIATGAVLTIEPGVVIKGANKYYPSLIVKGTLKAQGASDNMIAFTANGDNPQAGDWSGIIFDNASGISVLENIVFEYGGYQTNYNSNYIEEMIYADNSQLTFSNATIRHSANSGLYSNNVAVNISSSNFIGNNLNGIIIDGATNQSVVDHCQFTGNGNGILIKGQSSPVVSNNVFSNNIYPIYLISAYPDFQNNQASANTINGIGVDQNSQFTQDTMWRNDLAYVLQADFNNCPVVAVGAVLTIKPGTVIKPYNQYYTTLKVEGSLIMRGVADNLIVITSLNDDLYKGDTDNGDAGASSWKNINFAAGSSGAIDQVVFKNSGIPALIIDSNALVDIFLGPTF